MARNPRAQARMIGDEPEYVAAFEMLQRRYFNHATPVPGECSEFDRPGQGLADMWIAYNPHDERVETSRGQQLEPGAVYIEVEGVAFAMLDSDGGRTITGRYATRADVIASLEPGAPSPPSRRPS